MVDEVERVTALWRLNVLDTANEAALDEVVEQVARIFDAPTALISLVDSDRQWFKARVGLDLAQTPRHSAFADHTIRQGGVLVVEDTTADPRFGQNPLVLGAPGVRFYAGAPLVTGGGAAIGSLCVLDTRVRTASTYQRSMLLTLADEVVRQLETGAGHHRGPAGRLRGPDQPVWRHPEHLDLLVGEGSTGYVETTADGVILNVNTAAARMLGYEPAELVGRSARAFAHPDYIIDTDSAVAAVRSGTRSSYQATRVYQHRTGRAVHVRCAVSYLPPTPHAPATIAALLFDVKDVALPVVRPRTHDPVSGLANRALFHQRVQQAVDLAEDDGPVAVLVLRVHGPRAVSDLEGFPAGDSVVARIAERLTTHSYPHVTLASLARGVFAAFVPGGAQDATALANRFLTAVGAPLGLPGGTVTLRASIGISKAGPETLNSDSDIVRIVQDAENAAMVARDQGGNVVVFATPEMRRARNRQYELGLQIRWALDRHQVGLVFQPVFDLATGLVVSTEASLRLTDPQGHPIAPPDVRSAAQAAGLLVELGDRVLRLAAAQAAQWHHDHGIRVPVAVNVSAAQLTRSTFTAEVLTAVQLAGVPPQALTLELTETDLFECGSTGRDQLRVLRAHGVHLAIDDFGTGYASLVHLRDLPATTVKIDRSFVDGIPDDAAAVAIVAGVIGVARSLSKMCIAQGIETKAQRQYLTGQGVLGLGSLLAQPADGTSVGRLIAQNGAQPKVATADARSVAEARDEAPNRVDKAESCRGEHQVLQAETGLADDNASSHDRRDPTRRAAAAEPKSASHDSEAGAGDDACAGRDRMTLITDRAERAAQPLPAKLVETAVCADHKQGTDETSPTAEDRSTLDADRSAARDQENNSVGVLTGVHAREQGIIELEREIARAGRTSQSLIVAFVSVGHLKVVTELAGHAAGDELRRSIAYALRIRLRSYDLIIRYGADEFLCAMSGLSLLDATARLAEANVLLSELPSPASFTVGLAERERGDTSEGLIARAVAALYDQRRKFA